MKTLETVNLKVNINSITTFSKKEKMNTVSLAFGATLSIEALVFFKMALM